MTYRYKVIFTLSLALLPLPLSFSACSSNSSSGFQSLNSETPGNDPTSPDSLAPGNTPPPAGSQSLSRLSNISKIELAALNGGDINSDGTRDGFKINGLTGVGVSTLSDRFGDSLNFTKDLNGDGFNDLLIGAPQAEPSSFATADNRGEVYVLFGNTGNFFIPYANGNSGINGSNLTSALGITFVGNVSNESIGRSVGGNGDLNGDSIPDLVFSSSNLNPSNGYVFYGNHNPLGQIDNGAVFERIPGGLTTSICSDGDLDNDGKDDAIIGNGGADLGNGFLSGAVFIVFGNTSTSLENLNPLDTSNGSDVLRFPGTTPSGFAGAAISCVGDINKDNYSDFAFSNNGKVYLVFGNSKQQLINLSNNIVNRTNGYQNGLDSFNGTNGGVILQTPLFSSQIQFGKTLGKIGDFNNDGYDDLAIGAIGPGTNGLVNFVYVLFGKSSFTSNINVDTFLSGSTKNFSSNGFTVFGYMGSTLPISGGDFNGDGFDDLVVGSPVGNRALVLLGTTDIQTLLSVPHAFPGNSSNAYVVDLSNGASAAGGGFSNEGEGFALLSGGYLEKRGIMLKGPAGFTGNSVASGEDFNNDGFEDIAIGSPNNSANSYAGQVFVLYGQRFSP